MPEIILAVIVVLLLGERVWERVWAEQPPCPPAQVDRIEIPVPAPEYRVEYVERRPIPTPADWDGYEGQAGLS